MTFLKCQNLKSTCEYMIFSNYPKYLSFSIACKIVINKYF